MDPEAPQRRHPSAGALQCLALHCQDRGAMACFLPGQLSALSRGLSTGPSAGFGPGVLEAMAGDLRKLLRMLQDRASAPERGDPRWTDPCSPCPESGAARAGYDGYKRKKGSKAHVAVDTLGHLLAVAITPANEQERAQVEQLWPAGPGPATEQKVQVAFVDQGYTRAGGRAGRRRPTTLIWWWSNWPRPRRALCCCLAAGWSKRTFAWLGPLPTTGSRLRTDPVKISPLTTGWPPPSLMLGSLFSLLQSA